MTQRSATMEKHDIKTAEKIFAEIMVIEKRLHELKKQVLKLLPAKYGSDAWWEKAEQDADEDIKKRRVIELNDINDLDKSLRELFP